MLHKKQEEKETKRFLSVPDLSIILGLSRQAIYSLIKKGQIKAKHIGRRFFISQSFLDDLENYEKDQS